MSHRPSPAAGPTRRRILQVGMTGLGAAALTGLGNSITTRPDPPPPPPPNRGIRRGAPAARWGQRLHPVGDFGRMSDRPGFAPDSPQLRQALLTIGEPGGLLDAQDDLFGPHGGPVTLITDPA